MAFPHEAMSIPRFSIITPCLNRVEFIAEAVVSVLSQNYPSFEHIIIDGGSVDGTLEILKKYPHLRVISETDQGMYDAINKGLELACGEIIGFLNTDDMYGKDVFNAVAEKFMKQEVFAVAGKALVFSIAANGVSTTVSEFSPKSASLLELSTIGSPYMNAWFFQKAVFKSIGRFNISYQIVADRDFMLRFALSDMPYALLDNVVYQYRQHFGSMTFDITDKKLERIVCEHTKLTDVYLRQSGLSPEIMGLIREFRTRDTVEMAFRNLKKFMIINFFRNYLQGSKYDRRWFMKFVRRLINEIVMVSKKIFSVNENK